MTAAKMCLRADNHSYRYGDGLFETMKVSKGKISLADMHFQRLYYGLSILKFHVPGQFSQQNLEKETIDLCKRNRSEDLARVRLSVSRGSGGLYDGDDKFQYLIECWPLRESARKLNEHGLVLDIFPDARKSCDVFANLKSASHLIYVMAARFAKENKLNDCLLLNTDGRICDATIANLFWIKDEIIFTPPLSEGCIAGVKRRYLMERLQTTGLRLREENCEISDLENADELFLTNAIQGIRWVKQFRNKSYTNSITGKIFQLC